MCVTCGCDEGASVTITNLSHSERPQSNLSQNKLAQSEAIDPALGHSPIGSDWHSHQHPDGSVVVHRHGPAAASPSPDHHHHSHPHHHDHPQAGLDHYPTDRPSLTATDPVTQTLHLEARLLDKNNQLAAANRQWFQTQGIWALNLMSGPGAGKTTLLVKTLTDLADRVSFAVIEGDQATLNDAERVRATGCPVVQVNTGTGCHLDAAMVQGGCQQLQPPPGSILAIENVGNLVCPALFDLGEASRVGIFSVTEGEDKPLKYPHLFRACDLVLLSKIDLLPYLPFDLDRAIAAVKQVNPKARILPLSSLTGEGLADWYDWLLAQRDRACPLATADLVP